MKIRDILKIISDNSQNLHFRCVVNAELHTTCNIKEFGIRIELNTPNCRIYYDTICFESFGECEILLQIDDAELEKEEKRISKLRAFLKSDATDLYKSAKKKFKESAEEEISQLQSQIDELKSLID